MRQIRLQQVRICLIKVLSQAIIMQIVEMSGVILLIYLVKVIPTIHIKRKKLVRSLKFSRSPGIFSNSNINNRFRRRYSIRDSSRCNSNLSNKATKLSRLLNQALSKGRIRLRQYLKAQIQLRKISKVRYHNNLNQLRIFRIFKRCRIRVSFLKTTSILKTNSILKFH